MNKELQYEEIKEKTLKQFKKGESLFGKDGAFAPILKSFINEALKAEMEAHLDEEARSNGNKRNSKKTKTMIFYCFSSHAPPWLFLFFSFFCNENKPTSERPTHIQSLRTQLQTHTSKPEGAPTNGQNGSLPSRLVR